MSFGLKHTASAPTRLGVNYIQPYPQSGPGQGAVCQQLKLAGKATEAVTKLTSLCLMLRIEYSINICSGAKSTVNAWASLAQAPAAV